MIDEPRGIALKPIELLFGQGTIAGLSDAQLLERFLARRETVAFEALVMRHGPMVLAICRGVLDDPQDTEDAFQATFLVLARKAGSIRGRDALGGWLHRVAHRVAVQASLETRRRRGRERRVAAMNRMASSQVDPHHDLWVALHEEVARLPERLRLPILLCHLQGRTHAQAAAELRWGEATVRRRLAGARDLLRSRLTRRGLAPAGALLSTLAERQVAEAAAALPTAWAGAAVRSALEVVANGAITAGVASAPVIALCRKVLWTMSLPRFALATATVLALGVLIAGTTGRGHDGDAHEEGDRAAQSDPPAAGSGPGPVAGPSPTPRVGERQDATGEVVRYGGRVLDPQGKPSIGATLYLVYSSNRTAMPSPKARATTDPDGRFRFEVPRSELDATVSQDSARAAQIVAVAPGWGPAWINTRELEGAGATPDLKLATDDVPIRGRILDLEGRPVVGATIRIQSIFDPAGGSLRGRPPGLPEHLVTDAQGGFRLEGIGRDRTVVLAVDGPTIQHHSIQVRTLDVATQVGPRPTLRPGGPRMLYGATFDLAVPPGRALAGVVRDLDTRRPLAGLRVLGVTSQATTITDAEGRYELAGSPKGKEHAVYVRPAEQGHPYFNSKFTFPDTPGLGTLRADLDLLRGIPLHIRVVDGVTGAPVPGPAIHYYPLSPNPHVRREFTFGSVTPAYPQGDGTNLGVAWPGPGAIGVRAAEDMRSLVGRYQPARIDPRPFFGAGDGAKSFGDADHLLSALHDPPQRIVQAQFHAIVLIEPAAGTESIDRVIALEPGRTLAVTILDAEGEALIGARIQQRAEDRWGPALEAARFEVTGLNPERPRTVWFKHEPRRLVGLLVARGDEPDPASVRLRPWGAVIGRLVDRDGKPRPGVGLRTWGVSGDVPPAGHPAPLVRTDQEGRFLIEELIEGMRYEILIMGTIDGAYPIIEGKAIEGLTIRSGERKDLGDIRVGSDRPAPAP